MIDFFLPGFFNREIGVISLIGSPSLGFYYRISASAG